MLLTAICCQNFAITIFIWGSLWVETPFFLLLFDRSCRFPRCSNSKLSLSNPSVVQSKKVGWDMNTHLHRRSYAPRQTAPLGPGHFLSKTLPRQALEVNRSSPKIADQDAHYGIASQYHWVSKKHQKQLPSFMLRDRSGPQRSKKMTRTSTLTGRPRARTPSSISAAVFLIAGAHPALRFFSSAIYSCLGDLATCFTCLHHSKQAKKAHVVCEPWAWLSNMHAARWRWKKIAPTATFLWLLVHFFSPPLMQPVLHATRASLHHLHAQ